MSLTIAPLNTLLIPFIGIMLVSFITGILSPLLVLKQRSFLTDTLAHLIFPGVVAGILLSEFFHFEIWICMMVGACTTALLGSFLVEWLLRVLKIPPDSAAIVGLSGFFSAGVILMYTQKKDEGIDPEALLFGDVMTLNLSNIIVLVSVLVAVLLITTYYRNHWNAWLTDPEFAEISGYKIHLLNKIFPVIITASVLSGFFAVGGLMIPALMTLPAVFGRPKNIFSVSAILFSLLIGICGFLFAVTIGLPVGPTIVLIGFLTILLQTILGNKRLKNHTVR